jgi:hypothetical protein
MQGMNIEREGDGAWVLLNAEGDEISRRTSRAELQAHWDRLSAHRAIEQRDESGNLVEHRASQTIQEASANARRGGWSWASKGAGLRKYQTKSPDDEHDDD